MLGLNRNVVRLSTYRQEWKELFDQEKELLESLIGEYVVDIQHIGSTAIEGIAAKPIIDVLIGLRSLDDVQKFDKHRLKKVDIYHLGRVEIDGKEVFAKFSDLEDLTKTHVYHVVEYGGDWWQQHTLFRDYLNEHPDVALQYETLKRKSALKYPDDERLYADEKKGFVDNVLKITQG